MPAGRIMPCYGSGANRKLCGTCELSDYCRSFAAADRAIAVGKSRVAVIPERIAEAENNHQTKPVKKYTSEDMQQLIRFFLTLSVEEMQILQLRIMDPECSSEAISRILGISRKTIYRFFQRETLRIPELAKLLYRQKNKKGECNGRTNQTAQQGTRNRRSGIRKGV